MIFAQFYQRGTGYIPGSIPPRFVGPEAAPVIEATGDRSVVVIDGRLSSQKIGAIAAAECKKRGYVAWRIFKGETFTRSRPLSQVNYADYGRSDNSAMSATWGA